MGVSKVSDADFDAEVLKSSRAGGGRFLGRVVRPVQDDRARAGRDRRHDERQGQDREAQRRREPATAAKYGIMSIPTLMLFKNGELASRQVGAAPKQKLEQWITSSTAA